MGELGAAILNTCAPAGNRRAVQELAFNKLRFIEASHAPAVSTPSAATPGSLVLSCVISFSSATLLCYAASLCAKQTSRPYGVPVGMRS